MVLTSKIAYNKHYHTFYTSLHVLKLKMILNLKKELRLDFYFQIEYTLFYRLIHHSNNIHPHLTSYIKK